MKRFLDLYQSLDTTTRTNDKVDALVDYFSHVDAKDAVTHGRIRDHRSDRADKESWSIGERNEQLLCIRCPIHTTAHVRVVLVRVVLHVGNGAPGLDELFEAFPRIIFGTPLVGDSHAVKAPVRRRREQEAPGARFGSLQCRSSGTGSLEIPDTAHN